MNAIRTIDIELTDEIAAELDDAIARGEYFTAQAAVRDLLQIWSNERASREIKLERLRQLIQDGLDSGEPVDGNFDLDDIKRRHAERATINRN